MIFDRFPEPVLTQRGDGPDGHLTSGASEATLSALCIAHNLLRTGGHRIPVLTSDLCHSSVAKAAEILDLDLVRLPAGPAWTLTREQIRQAAAEAIADGVTGIIVVATAGNYNSGFAGPVDEIATDLRDIAFQRPGHVRCFLHVDAAHGGFVFPFTAPTCLDDLRRHRLIPTVLAEESRRRGLPLAEQLGTQDCVNTPQDIHPDNILIQPGGKIALLDFNHATPAEAASDFVKLDRWCLPSAPTANTCWQQRGAPADPLFEQRLAFHRLVITLPYFLYWHGRDPTQPPGAPQPCEPNWSEHDCQRNRRRPGSSTGRRARRPGRRRAAAARRSHRSGPGTA
ncbi:MULTISPECIES: pyridoxal-dependent decarboxylase [Streptomyces]|uniref:Aspartate aminotransferase family protein n=1 Tax=Streptomyces dengpaensis TaxID=2049881 RepID=A0ABN5I1X4_9ACTN|nr:MULTISPECIES: pyridoxal-dependent decarboxylase [Streptomyces]AVH55607.1 hypothetical protein C4B68_07225 [Streptomyces dengpaensis]PIB11869.1 hypothetical protein B1C81_01185 [Streptomyces sp. HG99]